MKIIIHTYPKRLWYVNNFLVPSLQAQGLYDITIINDRYHIGNLNAFIMSLKEAPDAWHLQDDVLICKDFAKRIQGVKRLSCGFYAKDFEEGEIMEGSTDIKNMWFSFPCLFIPGKLAREFYNWFKSEEKSEDFKRMIQSGKMDDLIFKEYLIRNHPQMKVNNISPCLVEHIDYLIGGSICNGHRTQRAVAGKFADPEAVQELESKITAYKVENNLL